MQGHEGKAFCGSETWQGSAKPLGVSRMSLGACLQAAMRILFKCAVVLFAVYIALLAGLYWAMRQPPSVFGRIISKLPAVTFWVFPFEPMWLIARKGNLKVGEMAPDFALKTKDCSAIVRLSSLRGKEPVVLIFGSYT